MPSSSPLRVTDVMQTGTKKMSLTEFMADPSLGTPSWIEDDFDITSTLNSNPFKPAAPSPFGNSGSKSNFFERSHNGFGMREGGNDGFHEPDIGIGGGASWRSSAMPRGGQSLNYKNSNIIVFDNVPPFCTRQLIKELFESRYTKLEKCHVLLDPSDPAHKKKIAFVFLCTPQDMQKVLKWNGINIERSRIIIDSASSNEFQAILQFNHDLNFDEDLEDKRIEDEQKEQREQRLKRQSSPTPITTTNTQSNKPKANPFGNAKPVVIPEIPIISESTKEIAKVLNLASKPDDNPHHAQPRVNPFGNAKPVLVPEIPIISENTAEIARKLDLKVDASKKSSRANSISGSPVRAVAHPKPNPFGNARPVDTLAKQLEIEKKLTKAAVNETTFDMTLIHGKKVDEKAAAAEKEKVKENDEKVHNPGSPVKILRRKDSVGGGTGDRRRDGEESKSPSSSSSSSSSGKGYKTTSGFERRIARDLSEEEYEQEMKKRNELRSHSTGKERGRGAGRRMSGGRFGNKQRYNAAPGTAHGGHGHAVPEKHDEHDGIPQEPNAKSIEEGKDKGKGEEVGCGKPSEGLEDYVQHEHKGQPAGVSADSGVSEPASADAKDKDKEESKVSPSEDLHLEKTAEETPGEGEEMEGGDAGETCAETPSSPSSTAAISRVRGRGRGGRGGHRRGRGGRGGRGDYSESGWGREGYGGYARGRGKGSSNRSRGEYNGRGGYRNLVYHKPTTIEAVAKDGSKDGSNGGADAQTEPRTESRAATSAKDASNSQAAGSAEAAAPAKTE